MESGCGEDDLSLRARSGHGTTHKLSSVNVQLLPVSFKQERREADALQLLHLILQQLDQQHGLAVPNQTVVVISYRDGKETVADCAHPD